MDNVAFLELKYGNIYGGYPNFFVISEASVIVFEPRSKKIFVESLCINVDLDIIFVNTKVNDLGHTLGRIKFVRNLRNGRKKPYNDEFKLNEKDLEFAFKKSRGVKKYVKIFFQKVLRKYRFNRMVTFDGRRDVFLVERCGVDFRNMEFYDLQRELNMECNYLFSLNKLGVITNVTMGQAGLRSNNLDYYIHPIAGQQLRPKSAAMDAARLLMVYQELHLHKNDFLMKAALLLNKIQVKQDALKAAKEAAAKEAAAKEAAAKEAAKAIVEQPSIEESAVEETETTLIEEQTDEGVVKEEINIETTATKVENKSGDT